LTHEASTQELGADKQGLSTSAKHVQTGQAGKKSKIRRSFWTGKEKPPLETAAEYNARTGAAAQRFQNNSTARRSGLLRAAGWVSFAALVIVLIVVPLLLLNRDRVAAPVEIPNVAVVSAAHVDERLFLMRLLEELYSEWPTNVSNATELEKKLGELKHRANRHYEDIQQKGLDDSLASLYQDFTTAVDAYVAYLAEVGRIESGAVRRSEKESAESGFSAGTVGAEAGYEMYDNGASGFASVATAAVVAFGKYLWDDYNKSKERDVDKEQAVRTAYEQFNNTLSTYIGRCQSAALSLSEKYSWTRGEAGFDESPDQAVAARNAADNKDITGLSQIAKAALMRRPNDPFAIAREALVSSLYEPQSPQQMISFSNRCVAAASLVPTGGIYDEYRAWFLYLAGDIANRASTKEIGDRSWVAAGNRTAAHAVGLWNECLKFAPNDPAGEYGELRAWALMQSGHLNEALRQARLVEPLRRNTLRFAYNFARLLSCTGEHDASFAYFEHAVRNLGYNAILQAKRDPDLRAMRSAHKREFDNLTAVRWGWRINYGAWGFNDDILITNNSAFALTNVTFDGKFTSSGGSWTPHLTPSRLEPGETYEGKRLISVPGNNIDASSTGSLTADQTAKPIVSSGR
jgi:hypothetical protein